MKKDGTKGPQPCSWPGCDRLGAYRVGNEYRCNPHRHRDEIPGWRDLYCRLCGYGPLTRLIEHIRTFHGEEALREQRRLHGTESLYSTDFLTSRRDQWRDRLEDDLPGLKKRAKRCRKGHVLTPANSYLRPKGSRCRKCNLEEQRARRWKNRPAYQRRQRKCRWCGRMF